MISRIAKTEVCVIHRTRRLRWITQTEALIILDIIRKPNLCNNCFIIYSKVTRKQSHLANNGLHRGLVTTACNNTFLDKTLVQKCIIAR